MAKIVATFTVSDVQAAWKEAKKALKAMTVEERTKTLVQAGVLTRTGKIAKPYADKTTKPKKAQAGT